MVVVDSNVWISAIVFGGTPRMVLKQIILDGVKVVVSDDLLSEVRRILHTKFPDFVQDFEDLLVVLAPRLQVVKLGAHTVTACRDPKDNMVIETALAGKVSTVVTGDKDLLSLKQYEGNVHNANRIYKAYR